MVGPSSPVVQAIAWLEAFWGSEPEPDLGTEDSKQAGLLAAHHLLQLMGSCGSLNIQGYHSSAVVLLRSLEDALDCFAAATLVPGAARRWMDRDLKPSDAAKAWTAQLSDEVDYLQDGEPVTLAEYRRMCRGSFHQYSHCSYDLCTWDLYLRPFPHPVTGKPGAVVEINRTGLVIDRNCHAIDAHLTAHLLEFIDLVKRAYGATMMRRPKESATLLALEDGVREIMETHNRHGCQDVRTPPELRPVMTRK